VTVILGDCLSVMKTMPDNSIDAFVEDPPSGIAFMNMHWDKDKGGRDRWIEWLTEIMQEQLRIAKPGAHMLCWALPRTSHWTATAIEDAGWEVRDVVTHLFGSGFPKSMDVGKAIDKAAGAERDVIGPDRRRLIGGSGGTSTNHGRGGIAYGPDAATAPATDAARQWDGWGTALKPAAEHWILARKPLSEPTVAANVLKWSTGALNIDQSRIKPEREETWEPERYLCDSCAEDADKSAKQTAPASEGSTVQSHVAPTMNGRAKTSQRATSKMDTGCFDGLFPEELNTAPFVDSSLSMSKSGKTITDPSQMGTLSTTKMRTDSTTVLRTCASCGEAITLDFTMNSEATPSLGRWPTNVVLSHADGCEEVGARKVRSGATSNSNGTTAWFGGKPSPTVPGYADADGMETVSAWRCVPGCPVAELDRQSGVRTSGGRVNTIGEVSRGNWRANEGRADNFRRATASQYPSSTGTASRFFFVAKPSRAERERGLAAMARQATETIQGRKQGSAGSLSPYAGVGGGSIQSQGNTPRANIHPTVKSTQLMRHLLTLVVPPGGIVLDPFAGSGSTGVAAAELGMEFIGIEKEPAYHAIALARIEDAELRMEAERVLPLFAHAGIEL
jgi:DNA modification methylase